MNAITLSEAGGKRAGNHDTMATEPDGVMGQAVVSTLFDTQDIIGIMKRAKVMLVEDSALIRDALTDALALSSVSNFDGFATTSDDAIAKLRAQRYNIVVIDIELAQGTGFDVLKDINQADFPYTRPVCMILTNHAYPIYKHKAEHLGVKYFFDKSMHFDEAIETIEMEASRLGID